MTVVLDTNVIVSGFLNPHGAPGRLVQMAASGSLELVYDPRIVAEYREVLSRDSFGLDAGAVGDFLEQVQARGGLVACRPLPVPLPDPDDEPFLEAAIAAGCVPLVTGNTRHFPASARQDVQVLSPAEMIEALRA